MSGWRFERSSDDLGETPLLAIRSAAMREHLQRIARVPEFAARGLVRLYRYTLSPLIGFHCRHLPTCSEYSDDSFARFGFWAGGWMTLARLCRCQPFGTAGIDLVPQKLPPSARWYAPWRYGRWRGTLAAPETSPPRG
jgi:putative membrane protein insertion efficiency factor